MNNFKSFICFILYEWALSHVYGLTYEELKSKIYFVWSISSFGNYFHIIEAGVYKYDLFIYYYFDSYEIIDFENYY